MDTVTAAAMLAGPTHPAATANALAAAVAATMRAAERAESAHHTATRGAAVYPAPPPIGTVPTHPGTTPAPAYIPTPPPERLGETTPGKLTPMDQHERMRVRAAAFRATRLYPGPVGELVQRELLTWEEFGYRLGGGQLVMRLVAEVLRTPLHQDVPA